MEVAFSSTRGGAMSLGNVDPGASGTVTIALATPTTSVLSRTLTAQLVNGSATFAALWLTRSGTALRLTATTPGLTSARSAGASEKWETG